MAREFVLASRLSEVCSKAVVEHPVRPAADEEIRRAIEDRERREAGTAAPSLNRHGPLEAETRQLGSHPGRRNRSPEK